MIGTLVLALAYLQPSDLTTFHCLHAQIKIGEELRVVDREHISDFTPLIEKDKLSIIESCLVFVVQSVTWLGQRSASLRDRHNL